MTNAISWQVLVHGEAGGMMRLKEALKKQAALRSELRQFYTPALGQPVRIPHKAERMAKVSGLGPGPLVAARYCCARFMSTRGVLHTRRSG